MGKRMEDRVNNTPALPAGTLLQGRYEIVAVLEEFDHASFYAAFDRELSQRVCIKTSLGAKQSRPRAEWLKEARIQMQLHHEHIPRCLNYVEEEGVPFIVMEELYETRMSDLLAREHLGMQRIHAMAMQLMDVLDHIHQFPRAIHAYTIRFYRNLGVFDLFF